MYSTGTMWNFLISDVSKEMVCHILYRGRRELIQKANALGVMALFLLSHQGLSFYCIPLKAFPWICDNAG